MENDRDVYSEAPEIIAKLREFIMLRFSLKVITPESLDKLIDGTYDGFVTDSAIRSMIEKMNDARNYVIENINEFGVDSDYAKSLINNEDTGPDEFVAFIDKLIPDTTLRN